MKRAIVLGAGMVGTTMARDLAEGGGFEVTLADARDEGLAAAAASFEVQTVKADLSDAARLAEVVADADIVLGALSSVLGRGAMRSVIEAGKDYCDISFMEEDPRDLDGLAKERGVTVVYDCGVAPGMTNILSGWAAHNLAPCERLDLYVGGVPVKRFAPYEYKAGFSPSDVIEEYTRPARLVQNGREVVKEALSEVELLDFEDVGTLEAFNTDGLRSLVDTLDVPEMSEKTMRWPGHADLMRAMRDTGLFDKTPIEVNGAMVRPLDLTSALLFPKWKFEPGEADLLVLRVVADGTEAGREVRHSWDMIDTLDPKTGERAMSRTTGFPATIMARLIADGAFARPGVHPPEVPGAVDGVLETMLRELEARGVRYRHRVESRPAQASS